MTIDSPEDMLHQARTQIPVSNCATCQHSSPHPVYFSTNGIRICNAFGGRRCDLVNEHGDCLKYQLHQNPEKSTEPVRLAVVANCMKCVHSRKHPMYFDSSGTLLCDANGGDRCYEHNRGGNCKLFEERSGRFDLQDSGPPPRSLVVLWYFCLAGIPAIAILLLVLFFL